MRRTQKWHEEQAEKERREMQQLFEESARSRMPAARLYPNLKGSWRSIEVARHPTETKSRAQIVYPHLPRGTK